MASWQLALRKDAPAESTDIGFTAFSRFAVSRLRMRARPSRDHGSRRFPIRRLTRRLFREGFLQECHPFGTLINNVDDIAASIDQQPAGIRADPVIVGNGCSLFEGAPPMATGNGKSLPCHSSLRVSTSLSSSFATVSTLAGVKST